MPTKKNDDFKDEIFSLSNKKIQQDLDTLIVLTTSNRFKEAKEKIHNIRLSLNVLEAALLKAKKHK